MTIPDTELGAQPPIHPVRRPVRPLAFPRLEGCIRMTRSFPRRRGAVLAIGVIAAAGLTAASSVPAFGAAGAPAASAASTAGGGAARGPAAVSVPAAARSVRTPDADSPVSGAQVSGARYGAAARSAAGGAAADFGLSHQRILNSMKHNGPAPSAAQLHDWWGTFPNTNSGAGGMATQSIDPNFRLSNSADVLYAPTMKPADGSCIEVVTVHTTAAPQIWAWDWCKSIAPGAEVTVDSTFLSKYTTTVNGRTVYTQRNVQTTKSNNTWTSYLYNYQTSSWDKLFSSSGTDQSGLTYGWDMFEFYSNTNPSTGNTYVCGDIAKAGLVVESSNVQIETGTNTWTSANSGNSTWMPSASPNPTSYKCPSLVFTIVSSNNDWTVAE